MNGYGPNPQANIEFPPHCIVCEELVPYDVDYCESCSTCGCGDILTEKEMDDGKQCETCIEEQRLVDNARG